MATTVLGLKTFAASDPVDYNEVNDNYTKIDAGVKTALQGRAAHNLLDNSDFSKPVAQAGMNGAHGSTVYVVDRWTANACTAEQSQGCLKITTTKAYAHIYQKVTGVAGKTLTCAGKFSGAGVGAIRIYNENISTMYAELKNISVVGRVTFTVPNDVDTISVLLYPNQLNVASGLIYWAALYEGSYTADTLPAYQPKGYEAELAECMRYYQVFGKKRLIQSTEPNGGFTISERFPIAMRVAPTIKGTYVAWATLASGPAAVVEKTAGLATNESRADGFIGYYAVGIAKEIMILDYAFTASADL